MIFLFDSIGKKKPIQVTNANADSGHLANPLERKKEWAVATRTTQ